MGCHFLLQGIFPTQELNSYLLHWKADSLPLSHLESQESQVALLYFAGEESLVLVPSRFSHVRLFATLWTVAHQAPLSMGFSRWEYWSGLPCPPPGDFPHPEIELMSSAAPALQADSLALSHQGGPLLFPTWEQIITYYSVLEFSGGPVVMALCFHCRWPRFDSRSGN